MRLRSARSIVKHSGALMSSRLMRAEGRLERGDDVDQLLRIALVELDVEAVDAGELLEQHRLAFHHRLGGERADGAQAEHRGAVGHHGDQVGARGVEHRASPGRA